MLMVMVFSMQNDTTKFQQPIQVALTLVNERHRLRQENDKLTKKMAFFLELEKQLRDEIAFLKGQKPIS